MFSKYYTRKQLWVEVKTSDTSSFLGKLILPTPSWAGPRLIGPLGPILAKHAPGLNPGRASNSWQREHWHNLPWSKPMHTMSIKQGQKEEKFRGIKIQNICISISMRGNERLVSGGERRLERIQSLARGRRSGTKFPVDQWGPITIYWSWWGRSPISELWEKVRKHRLELRQFLHISFLGIKSGNWDPWILHS